MAKKQHPKPGDRVALRGRSSTGVMEWVNSLFWCRVKWDDGGPGLCHLFELQAEPDEFPF